MLHNCTSGDALENTTAEFESPEEEPDNPHAQTLVEALQRDPVSIARGIINKIRSSQLRCTDFKEIIETGNRRHRWQHEDGSENQLASLTLIRDSPLRWGSTYLMINRFLHLRLPIKVFMAPDVMSNVFKNQFTPCEWIVLVHIRVLEPAFALQSVMRTEKTPILACVVLAFDALISMWKQMQADPTKQHLRHMLDAGINKMTSQFNERRLSKTAIFSIVLHPSLRFKWLEDNWPPQHVEYARGLVMKEVGIYLFCLFLYALTAANWISAIALKVSTKSPNC
ncbi:hypothetical protein K439DRAFT_1355822 [Ramaria rubella]|nr:hypothetical protein K439DRAFT_1355822 [Ramaria rubella]